MLTTEEACQLAKSFDGVGEKEHFGGDAFVANKRIFATVWHKLGEVNLMLSTDQQLHFVNDRKGFFALENAWGRKGATKAQLAQVSKKDFMDALNAAFQNSKFKRT